MAFAYKNLSQTEKQRLDRLIQFIKKEIIRQPFLQVECTNASLMAELSSSKVNVNAWVNEVNRLYDYDTETCLKQLIQTKTTTKEAQLVINFAKIYYANQHGDSKTAIKLGQELLAQSSKPSSLVASVYRMIGKAYHAFEEYESSFSQYEKSIKIARQSKDIDNEALAWVAMIGVSREIFQNDSVRVNTYTETVKKLLPLIKNNQVRTYVLVELALFNQNDRTPAQLERLEAVSKTITLQSTVWAKCIIAMILNDFIYGHQEHDEDYVLFLQYFAQNMKKLPANYALNFNIGRAYLSLADFYQRKGKFNLAQLYMDTTFVFAGRSHIDATTYEVQSHIYESKGEYDKANIFLKKALRAYEKDYINRNNEVAFRNERRFYTKEKELKLALADEENKQKARLLWFLGVGLSLLAILLGRLFWQNRNVKRANQVIKNQSKELVILMKEVHHRVKNNLQMVSAILYMQAKASKEQEAIDALLNAEGRLKTIALVHESLYKSENIAKINLNEYLSELVNNLAKQANKPFDFSINSSTMLITNIDTAIPVGLIINELVINSVKYAFNKKEKGKIEIILHQNADKSNMLFFRDNGEGFADGKLPDAKSSLGIRLIKIFVQQLKGSLEYDQTNGVEFRLKFNSL